MEKIEYQAPELEEVGAFEAMTQSTNAGFSFDDNFNGIVEPNILS